MAARRRRGAVRLLGAADAFRQATRYQRLLLHQARLVAEGLHDRDIADQLFVSPRTVQTRLTHIYGKLGITSRVQLAQQAARHGAQE